MNPEKLGIEADDFENLQKDKFTQTDKRYLKKTACPSPPEDIVNKNLVTIFEFCQIIQKPDIPSSVTYIKDTLTEESTSNPLNSVKEGAAYRYCKEVILPYIRYRPDCLECEDDDILQAALELAGEDNLCQQHCIQIPEVEKVIKVTHEFDFGNFSKVNALDSYNSMDKVRADDKTKNDDDLPYCDPEPEQEEEPPRELPKCPPKPTPEIPKCIPKCSPRDPDCPGQPPSCSPRDPDCLPPDERGCAQPQPQEPDQPPVSARKSKCNKSSKSDVKPACITRSDTDKNSLTSLITKNKKLNLEEVQNEGKKGNDIQETTKEKTFTEAHNEAVSTIKVAMDDFIGKVYKTSQDAISLVAKESAKHLVTSKISEIFKTEKNEDDKNNSETLSRFSIFRSTKAHEPQEKESDGKYGPGAAAVNNILAKVDSVVTVISEHINKNFDNFQKSYNKSSPYDKPKPPTDIANKFLPSEPGPTQSVFSTIKSKLFSMFGDNEAKTEDMLNRSATSSSSSASDEEDDGDLIEKLID